jgi:hypothetical protein
MTPLPLAAWWLLFLVLLAAPFVVLRGGYGAGWRWLLLGAAAYALGIVLKLLLLVPVELAGASDLPAWGQASVMGMVSAAAELAVAVPFLWPRRGSGGRESPAWPDALAFGAAAGVAEMLAAVPLGLAQYAYETGQWPSVPDFTAALGWTFLLERGLTTVGHASSRALVYVGLRYRSLAPLLLAFALFSVNDGVPTYVDARGWHWDSRLTLKFYSLAAAITVAETAAAIVFDRRARREARAQPT